MECSRTLIPRILHTSVVACVETSCSVCQKGTESNDETLLTFMAEVESLLNGHPLWRQIISFSDLPIPVFRQMLWTTRICAVAGGGNTRK